jgi:hypothetical protein
LLYGLFQGVPEAVQLATVWLGPSVPVAAVVAFMLAPRAVSSESLDGPALAMGFFSVVLGAPAVSVVMAAAMGLADFVELIGVAIFLAIAGLIFVGWLYLVITIPSGYIWAALVRGHAGITT